MGSFESDHGGASEAQTKRQGKWNTTSFNGSYLHNTLPLETLRVLADFPKEQGTYFIARASMVEDGAVLEALIQRVFPLKKIEKQLAECEKTSGREIAGRQFLKFLTMCARIVIEDACVLLDDVFNFNGVYCKLIIL